VRLYWCPMCGQTEGLRPGVKSHTEAAESALRPAHDQWEAAEKMLHSGFIPLADPAGRLLRLRGLEPVNEAGGPWFPGDAVEDVLAFEDLAKIPLSAAVMRRAVELATSVKSGARLFGAMGSAVRRSPRVLWVEVETLGEVRMGWPIRTLDLC
jgi:hypothetical protein